MQASRTGPGGLARTILARSSPATRVVIDVLAQSGAGPSSATLSHLRSTLSAETTKSVGLNGPATLPGGGRRWTEAELRSLADDQGRAVQGDGQAVLRLLYVHGDDGGDRSVLGVALRADVMVIFSDVVDESSSPVVSSDEIERAVSTHELGHLLGLVDIVLKTGRQDPEHPGHSTNRNSVMYWAVEADVVSQVLGGSPPTTFDAADKQDLAAMRNGA